MFTIISLIIFWGALCYFGWQFARFFLNEERIEVLLPLSFIVGAAVYIFLLNATSYFIQITVNFYLMFFLLLLGGFIFWLANRKKSPIIRWGLNKREILIICSSVMVIMFFSGLIAVRTIESDDLTWMHLPLAASIAGGNFPVRDLLFPNTLLSYHYGYNLLLASVSVIARLPVWFVSDLIVFIFSGVIFLLLFSIARLIIKHNLKSYVVALVGMFGGGLSFIYIFDGIITLYKKFVLHYNIPHPFVFLAKMWGGGGAIVPMLTHQLSIIWVPLSLSMVLAILYLYLDFVNNNEKRNKLFFVILLTILMAVLSLTFEYASLVIGLTIMIYLFIIYFFKRDKKQFRILLFYSLLFLLFATALSLAQGGTVTVFFMNLIKRTPLLGQPVVISLFSQPFYFRGIPIFGKNAIIDTWGLLYFLIMPASYFIIRKHFRNGLFLVLMSFAAFLIPLVVSFNEIWQASMSKFFYLTQVGWSIIVGIFLMEIKDYFIYKKKFFWGKISILFLVLISLSGVFYLLTNYLYPSQPETKGFFGQLTKPISIRTSAYHWIKQNTVSQDYFLAFGDPFEMKLAARQNYKFILFTQRIAPTYQYLNDYPDAKDIIHPQTLQYRNLIESCNNNILKELKYKYLFVDNNWPEGLEHKCLGKNNLDLKFSVKSGEEFVRIYKVK